MGNDGASYGRKAPLAGWPPLADTGRIHHPAPASRYSQTADLLYRAAISARRHSGDAPKYAGQMMLIGETADQCDHSERCTSVAHRHLRSCHAPMKQKLIRSLARAPAKTAHKMRCTKSHNLSQLI